MTSSTWTSNPLGPWVAGAALSRFTAALVDPVALVRALGLEEAAPVVLLDSAGGSPGLARRHYLAWDPVFRLRARAGVVEVTAGAKLEGEPQARGRFESLLGSALEAGLLSDAVVAGSLAQSRALWHLRESIPLAQAEEGLNVKHDIALPVSAIPAYVASTDSLLRQRFPGVRLVNFGHLGDGNLHYNVQAPEGVDGARFLQAHEQTINTLVFDALRPYGGSFSAEHGIGALKRDELSLRKSPVALRMMRGIKAALDPLGILNPGRVL
jgi:FAD/FMN-containing dehydrogenase